MNITNLPNEILILIIQLVSTKQEHRVLFVIRIFTNICKHFNFLRKQSFLINVIPYYRNEWTQTFMSVDYLGNCNGPLYCTFQGKYYGYGDDKFFINDGDINDFYHKFYTIRIDEYIYEDINEEIYLDICQQLYENLDQEFLDFIFEQGPQKLCLIRPKFPKLALSTSQQRKISEMYVAKKINVSETNICLKFDNDES